MTTVTITCTTQQAECIARALDLYTRLGLGRFEEVAYLCEAGLIRHRHGECRDVQIGQIESLCYAIKDALGHPRDGSFGIGSPMLHESTQRACEIKKQIEKALAMHNNPNPEFRGANYDGRTVRYTKDPDIAVEIKA
jgi:hypothetical protein